MSQRCLLAVSFSAPHTPIPPKGYKVNNERMMTEVVAVIKPSNIVPPKRTQQPSPNMSIKANQKTDAVGAMFRPACPTPF